MPESEPPSNSEIVFYQAEDGRSRIQVRLEGETVWLSQRLLAELFQKDVRTISEHVQNIFEESELDPGSTIRKFRTVRTEGDREVSRLVDHYNLDVILAVGYRVRSQRGTQFRRWATERLREYLVKGFTLDDERLKEGRGPGADYFDELLERIRTSGRRRSASIRRFAICSRWLSTTTPPPTRRNSSSRWCRTNSTGRSRSTPPPS